MDRDGIDRDALRNVAQQMHLPGTYRRLICRPADLQWDLCTYADESVRSELRGRVPPGPARRSLARAQAPLQLSDVDRLEGRTLPEQDPEAAKWRALRISFQLRACRSQPAVCLPAPLTHRATRSSELVRDDGPARAHWAQLEGAAVRAPHPSAQRDHLSGGSGPCRGGRGSQGRAGSPRRVAAGFTQPRNGEQCRGRATSAPLPLPPLLLVAGCSVRCCRSPHQANSPTRRSQRGVKSTLSLPWWSHHHGARGAGGNVAGVRLSKTRAARPGSDADGGAGAHSEQASGASHHQRRVRQRRASPCHRVIHWPVMPVACQLAEEGHHGRGSGGGAADADLGAGCARCADCVNRPGPARMGRGGTSAARGGKFRPVPRAAHTGGRPRHRSFSASASMAPSRCGHPRTVDALHSVLACSRPASSRRR